MKYVVLVSHGGFAEGLKTSLAMFAADSIDQVKAIGLKENQDVSHFKKDCETLIDSLDVSEEEGLIVLADIVGGSPLTTLCGVLAERNLLDASTILGGMNLTMALTTVVLKEAMSGSDLVDSVFAETKSALQEFKVSVNDEDDDI